MGEPGPKGHDMHAGRRPHSVLMAVLARHNKAIDSSFLPGKNLYKPFPTAQRIEAARTVARTDRYRSSLISRDPSLVSLAEEYVAATTRIFTSGLKKERELLSDEEIDLAVGRFRIERMVSIYKVIQKTDQVRDPEVREERIQIIRGFLHQMTQKEEY